MMFRELIEKINELANNDFIEASNNLTEYIDTCHDFMDILQEIGIIPEAIPHDSTEEKLFSKASDAVLSRAFREIGLKATVLKERADSADVQAESVFHDYSLVADAKAFRMSRTAKNQKDFKVVSLSGWRQDADYAVLCSPYFQYPSRQSQIYAQSIDNNVCLFSWEHLIFFITNNIKESKDMNLAEIWNFGESYEHQVIASDRKNCNIAFFNETVLNIINKNEFDFSALLDKQRNQIELRGNIETDYWHREIDRIQRFSKEQAIDELIRAKKIDEKIAQISKYVGGLYS